MRLSCVSVSSNKEKIVCATLEKMYVSAGEGEMCVWKVDWNRDGRKYWRRCRDARKTAGTLSLSLGYKDREHPTGEGTPRIADLLWTPSCSQAGDQRSPHTFFLALGSGWTPHPRMAGNAKLIWGAAKTTHLIATSLICFRHLSSFFWKCLLKY